MQTTLHIFQVKKSLKIPSPRLLNLLTVMVLVLGQSSFMLKFFVFVLNSCGNFHHDVKTSQTGNRCKSSWKQARHSLYAGHALVVYSYG